MLKTTTALGALLFGGAALAQGTYPDSPITLIVPFAAGGPTDTVARLLGEHMSQTLGQSIVVENAPGAGTTMAAARVARAEPDGYTLYLTHVAHATAPALYADLAFDPAADFDGIGLVADVPMVILGKADFPAEDIAGYLEHVRASGDEILMGHAGVGSGSYLCGTMLQDALGVTMTDVPYDGTGPAMTDLLGGVIDTLCDQSTNATPQVAAGAVKGFAVTTPERVSVLGDLPTLQEAGLEGFDMAVWHGLYAPAGTPVEILDKVSGALQAALASEDVIARFAELGTAPVAAEDATPAALDAYLDSEIERWSALLSKEPARAVN